MPNPTNWTPETASPATAWTGQTPNPTSWNVDGAPVATGSLLLSNGDYLLLSTGDTLGIYVP